MVSRPVCAQCSRNAQTVDTPRVKVRVDSALVLRDSEGLRLIYRCHGAAGVTFLDEAHGKTWDETDVERTEVFRGDR